MTATLVLDPFEQEVTLADEPRVLSFAARSFELPLDELMRHLAFDVVAGIPRPLGSVREQLPGPSDVVQFASDFYQVGSSVLAATTEIQEEGATHRVIELLGVGGDVRVRLNLTQLARQPLGALSPLARGAIKDGWALGQVRIWGHDSARVAEIRRALERQMANAGIDRRVLDRSVDEPVYRPQAGGRMSLEALPGDDVRVGDMLLQLLRELPADGGQPRPPRLIASHDDRVRRAHAIVSYRYETHRAGTGVLHLRRREVEAGVERPGLVRTFNLAGIRGGARLRIRDVGGRASAEFAGMSSTVAALRGWLESRFGGRG